MVSPRSTVVEFSTRIAGRGRIFAGRSGRCFLSTDVPRTARTTVGFVEVKDFSRAKHWGETGGTLGGKDKEIRVRTGKLRFQARRGRSATTGVFSKVRVENKGLNLAPQVGLEPTTLRLTATQVHQTAAGWTLANVPHALRYLANGCEFSGRR